MEYTTGSKVLDGWEIVRPIGAGSYGKVFEVRKTSYGVETVSALKVIRIPESPAEVRSALNDGMDEQSVTGYFKGFVDEILHEIAIMSTVKSHPNVVSYEDHHLEEYPGEIRWDILIRMELLTPLEHYLREQARLSGGASFGALPVMEVVRLGQEIAGALAFCQRKNIIHRDIKPENIFISEAGQFKLGDFGVAKTAASRSTGGSHKGTERYMAPEVFLNQPYGPSVDIYSLGLVMYRLLNGGRLPFLPPAPKPLSFGDYENAQIRRMQGVPVPPPSLADKPLADIVLKACAFRSADRFRSAAELYAALDAYAGGYKTFPDSRPTEPEAVSAGEPLPSPGETGPGGEAAGSVGDGPEPARMLPEGTVGGWNSPKAAAAPQEGTVGGWGSPEVAEMPQEGTVGGWGSPEVAEMPPESIVGGRGEQETAPVQPPMTRAELLSFWMENLPKIRIPKKMHVCCFAPEIPENLLQAARERAGDKSDPASALGILSFRSETKWSFFESVVTAGTSFWGMYVTETGFALLGKKKSNLITNIVTGEYRQIRDAKVLEDGALGFHKLKLLMDDGRILLFSPEEKGDHYDYYALCHALLALRDRFRKV